MRTSPHDFEFERVPTWRDVGERKVRYRLSCKRCKFRCEMVTNEEFVTRFEVADLQEPRDSEIAAVLHVIDALSGDAEKRAQNKRADEWEGRLRVRMGHEFDRDVPHCNAGGK